MGKRILILGGTGDALQLASQTSMGGFVKVSLAGRTNQSTTADIRVGGFGGVSGLTAYLQQEKIDLLIDATHPFAAQISWNAAAASRTLGIQRLMLVRNPWQQVAEDNWHKVANITEAADNLYQSQRVFLSIGRQQLAAFNHVKHIWFLMRTIAPPADAVPQGLLLCDRAPFELAAEKHLLQHHQIDTIVSKNSGGDATYAKIIAARELGIKVVMVSRPKLPQGDMVENVEQAIAWINQF